MKILSLDGGGIRGVLSARIVERIESARPFLAAVDVFSGTSVGSINAAWYASGRPASGLVQMFRERSRDIFADSLWDDLKDLGNLRGAQYGSEGLQSVLASTFGDARLRDLPKRVVITTVDLDNPGPPRGWRFKVYDREHDGDVPVSRAVATSAAAPTYFPVVHGCADGGLVANNPAACALAYAVAARRRNDPAYQPLPGDFSMLSVGTGRNPRWIEGEGSHDWGLSQWLRHLLDLIFDCGVQAPHFQCKQFLGGDYLRVQPDMPRDVPLDDADAVDELVQIADQVDLSDAIDFVARAFA